MEKRHFLVRWYLAALKPLGVIKYLFLGWFTLGGQTTDNCAMYKKYTLGMKGVGVLETHSFTEKGKSVTAQYVAYLVPLDSIIAVNVDSGTYRIPHPDYPNCREVTDILVDSNHAIQDAEDHEQVRVMLMLEIRDRKRSWKLVPYQHKH